MVPVVNRQGIPVMPCSEKSAVKEDLTILTINKWRTRFLPAVNGRVSSRKTR